jgi:hypothetical protein
MFVAAVAPLEGSGVGLGAPTTVMFRRAYDAGSRREHVEEDPDHETVLEQLVEGPESEAEDTDVTAAPRGAHPHGRSSGFMPLHSIPNSAQPAAVAVDLMASPASPSVSDSSGWQLLLSQAAPAHSGAGVRKGHSSGE